MGRNKWRIYIHELFDFGLCCMESFSSLASIRKLLKFVAALSIISGHVSGLTCWKCVGEECSGENFEEYSEKIHCEQGESCMKVVFEMVDYPSPLKYESVVRTCSRGPCEPITMETFNGCRGKTRSYRFYGCSIRTCCEQDYCNKTASITMGGFWASLLFPIFVIRIL